MRNQIPNIEKAIRKTGFGMYHKFLLSIASLNSLSTALISTILSFVLPLMICDIPMSPNMILTVNLAYSLGLTLGGFIFCALSDVFGRRYLLPALSGLVFASMLACSFVHGLLFLIIFVICLGSGLSAILTVMKIHLAEALPMKGRGFFLVFVDLFWTLGYFLSILIAWVFSPLAVSYYNQDARFYTWRVMCATSSVLSIFIGCTSNLIKPSIRYLLYIRQYNQAITTLKSIYAINNSRNCEEFVIKEEELYGQIKDYGINRNLPIRVYFEHVCVLLKTVQRALMLLITRKFLLRTLILTFLKFVMFCGIFITNMWLYKTLDYERSCRIASIDILHLQMPDTKCDTKLKSTAYRNFMLMGLNVLLGQVILVLIVERVGRRILIMCGCLICGICSLTLAFLGNDEPGSIKIGLSSLFLASYSLVDSTINIVIVEVFPTALRGTAAGVTQFVAGVASMFLKKYLNVPCNIPFLLAGAFMSVATVLAFFLPGFKGLPMME